MAKELNKDRKTQTIVNKSKTYFQKGIFKRFKNLEVCGTKD